MRLSGIHWDLIRTTTVLLLLAALWLPARGSQDPPVQDQPAPPPLRVIPSRERAQVNEARDPKARVKITLELADAHLTNATNKTSQQEFDNAAAEAGMYWALIEDLLKFLSAAQSDNNRMRDLYKRLELALRAHGLKLAIMRRATPAEHAVWLKEIEEFARESRTEALNSFYGHTVIRDAPPKPPEQKEAKKPF